MMMVMMRRSMIMIIIMMMFMRKQARKLQATLVQNYEPLTHLLTGVKCRATSVAKNATSSLVIALQDLLLSVLTQGQG